MFLRQRKKGRNKHLFSGPDFPLPTEFIENNFEITFDKREYQKKKILAFNLHLKMRIDEVKRIKEFRAFQDFSRI